MSSKLMATLELPIQVHMSIHSNRQLQVNLLKGGPLVWLENDPGAQEEANKAIDALKNGDKWDIETVRESLSKALEVMFLKDQMYVRPELKLVLEERDEKAFEHIIKSTPPPSWLDIIGFDIVLQGESTSVTDSDISLVGNAQFLYFSPIPGKKQLSIKLNTTKRMFLEKLELVLVSDAWGNGELKSCDVGRYIKEGEFTVQIPEINVRDYNVLLLTKVLPQLKLFLGGNNQITVSEGIKCEFESFESGVSLFVDMGSTQSKMISVESDWHDGKVTSPGRILQALTAPGPTEPYAATTEKELLCLSHGPAPSRLFSDKFGLQSFDKKSLDASSKNELKQWFAEAARRFAAYYASRKGQGIINIIWSFPKTQDCRDDSFYKELSGEITKAVAPSILGSFTVVPEHLTLKYRFESTLKTLGRLGFEKKEEKINKEKKNEDIQESKDETKKEHQKALQYYNRRSWFMKAFILTKPQEPDWSRYTPEAVPTVEEFYNKFMDINAVKGLKDFIAMDAGGYTLDVYGQISDKTFTKSVGAGGNKLTDRVLEFLNNEATSGNSKIFGNAELEKLAACAGDPNGKGTLPRKCKEWTREIYEPAIKEVTEWASDIAGPNKTERGLPIILSGCAMKNKFLRELIENSFDNAKMERIFVTSEEIAQIIEKYEELQQKQELFRFWLITEGCAIGTNKKNLAHDVCLLYTSPSPRD